MAPANQTKFVLGGPIVNEDRIRQNLAAGKGLIVAEAAMMGPAPFTDRDEAHEIVYDVCRG
jgi:3-carboxy-cis,cis-muconate cycloisomerase